MFGLSKPPIAPSLDVAFCRALFPAACWDWAFFENAGGSFVPKSVIQRLTAYMSESQVQPGAPFPMSDLAAERMRDGHHRMAAMLGADPDEVVIGPSTSANLDVLSRSLRPLWSQGDEVIVTDLNHEANSGPWRRLAETGIRIVEWPVNPDTAALDIDLLDRLLSDKTKLVAVPHVSNVTGDINDIREVVDKSHAAGALVCVDGVAYAPHRFPDVKALDADFYAFSLYKTYGPHMGLMYGKKALLEAARSRHHYFIPEAETAYKMNPAGPQHEMIASLAGIADYIDTLAAHHLDTVSDDACERTKAVYALFAQHEAQLADVFIDWARSRNDVRLLGRAEADPERRVPTFSFVVDGKSSEGIARAVEADKIAIRNGDFYARRLVQALGVRDPVDGVVRCSMAHYNTIGEADRLVQALDKAV